MMTQSLSSSSSLTAQNPNLCPVHLFNKSLDFGFVNVSRFSPTPNFSRSRLAVKCRQDEYLNQQSTPPNSSSSFSSQPSPRGPVSGSPRYFVGHSIYKGKAALTVQPVAPEFTALDSGAFKLTKEGYVLLQFAPAASLRVYDWGKKQVFSLSVTEIGNLVSLGSRESCEFFHDPYKGKSEEGQVRKVLKVEPLQDGSGHFFNLNVQNKLINVDEKIYIPVTKAEFAVLNAAFNFMLPYFLGWHAFASSARMVDDTNRGTNNASPRYGGDYEWNR